MQERQDVRAFGANLVLVMSGLFFGGLFFAFCYRRAQADEWRAAWDYIAMVPERLAGALACFLAAWLLYRKPLVPLSSLAGLGATGILCSFWPDAGALILEEGSRAPAIALVASTSLLALHAFGLSLWGLGAKGDPVFRRILGFQFALALLILPVVFTW